MNEPLSDDSLRTEQRSSALRRGLRGVAWGVLVLALAYVVWGGTLAIAIWKYAATQEPIREADAAVVLGARTWDSEPSPVFRERILHAIDLYDAGAVSRILLTGGADHGGELSEAEVAFDVLVGAGIPRTAILLESASHSTYENLRQAGRLAEDYDIESLLIVSDPLHMRRALTIARDLGLDAWPSPTPTTRYRSLASRIVFLLRETLAYSAYLIFRTCSF